MDIDLLKHELGALHEGAFGWAMLCCGRDANLASDVLQQAYCRVLGGQAVFGGRARLRTWLFGVIRGVALEEHRRLRRERGHGTDASHRENFGEHVFPRRAHEPEPRDHLERNEVAAALAAAMQQLSVRQRELLHLTFYESMSIAAAADLLGITVGSARQHYERGKNRLRQLLSTLAEPR